MDFNKQKNAINRKSNASNANEEAIYKTKIA